MSTHTPHELRDEFPEFADRLHDLKVNDNHFKKLADEYHDVNREIHRIEIGEDHVSQFNEEDLRKARMRLKDEIYALLKAV
ncbi:GTP-binding protein [Kordiimonas sediminis]|uniref:GTP-binding protein n=1 Tax=Kordiimonas sediminis TaxID=1735581 RepID=A0A919AYK4_9PROT|nr:DUF465 domain-containing protein [Kordiimonas sediminis]GHF29869.1 GTP-binding protein [Kordiimonas sediminis]